MRIDPEHDARPRPSSLDRHEGQAPAGPHELHDAAGMIHDDAHELGLVGRDARSGRQGGPQAAETTSRAA